MQHFQNRSYEELYEKLKLGKVEKKLLAPLRIKDANNNYTPVEFKNKALFVVAFIPESVCPEYNYESLEWIGDVVIKFLVFCFIFSHVHDMQG